MKNELTGLTGSTCSLKKTWGFLEVKILAIHTKIYPSPYATALMRSFIDVPKLQFALESKKKKRLQRGLEIFPTWQYYGHEALMGYGFNLVINRTRKLQSAM